MTPQGDRRYTVPALLCRAYDLPVASKGELWLSKAFPLACGLPSVVAVAVVRATVVRMGRADAVAPTSRDGRARAQDQARFATASLRETGARAGADAERPCGCMGASILQDTAGLEPPVSPTGTRAQPSTSCVSPGAFSIPGRARCLQAHGERRCRGARRAQAGACALAMSSGPPATRRDPEGPCRTRIRPARTLPLRQWRSAAGARGQSPARSIGTGRRLDYVATAVLSPSPRRTIAYGSCTLPHCRGPRFRTGAELFRSAQASDLARDPRARFAHMESDAVRASPHASPPSASGSTENRLEPAVDDQARNRGDDQGHRPSHKEIAPP
jgi:hypothetical protein